MNRYHIVMSHESNKKNTALLLLIYFFDEKMLSVSKFPSSLSFIAIMTLGLSSASEKKSIRRQVAGGISLNLFFLRFYRHREETKNVMSPAVTMTSKRHNDKETVRSTLRIYSLRLSSTRMKR